MKVQQRPADADFPRQLTHVLAAFRIEHSYDAQPVRIGERTQDSEQAFPSRLQRSTPLDTCKTFITGMLPSQEKAWKRVRKCPHSNNACSLTDTPWTRWSSKPLIQDAFSSGMRVASVESEGAECFTTI